MMRTALVVTGRELTAYFASPLAYVFIVVFLLMSGALTFFVGGFLRTGQADLSPFFLFHPWLYLFLAPAVGMRLWAEERKTGTIEFLLTQPLSTGAAVLGKFLAAWVFIGIALALTVPLWITVNVLGNPDNGAIAAAYLGSWLMAGAMLALASCVSAMTGNQVIAFVLAAAVGTVFLMAGVDFVQAALRGWASPVVQEAVAGFSFINNFQSIAQGVLDLRNLIFFISVMVFGLMINTAVVELKKTG